MHTTQLLATVRARHEAFRAARDLIRDRLAPDFSPFQFIAPDEVGLSRLLAWLLDPRGSHGQGERFLAAFLARLDLPWNTLPTADALVETEAATNRNNWANRRIDVLVRGQNWSLAFENKPWAGDQKDQVKDYLTYLERLPGRPHALVYLSGWGNAPSEDSISKDELERRVAAGELHLWSYADLVPWLETCKSLCRADRVAIFIDEFIGYIQCHFQGVRDMTEREQIIEAMMASPESLETAMLIAATAFDVRKRLVMQLTDQLKQACPLGWIVTNVLQAGSYPRVSIRYPGAADFAFLLEMGDARGRFAPVTWGIIRTAPMDRSRSEAINRALNPIFGKSPRYDWWPWYHPASRSDPEFPIPKDWEADPLPWTMIVKGELHKVLLAAAKRVQDVLVKEGLMVPDPTPSQAAAAAPEPDPVSS